MRVASLGILGVVVVDIGYDCAGDDDGFWGRMKKVAIKEAEVG